MILPERADVVLAGPMPKLPRRGTGWRDAVAWGAYLRELSAIEAEAIERGDRRREAIAWSRRYEAQRALLAAQAEPEAEDLASCVLRASAIRGATDSECRRRKVCFLCGQPLTGRQLRWCKGGAIPCWQTWSVNHSWTSARDEAVARSSGLPSTLPYRVRYPLGRCDDCAETSSLEVNHVVPRVGAGYDDSCAHHQTNLQVLAHPCHVVETNRQAAERRGERAAANDPTIPLWEGAA